MLENTINTFDGREDQKANWTDSHFKNMVGFDENCGLGNTLPGNSSWKGKKQKERSIENCKTGKSDLNKGQRRSKKSTPIPNLPSVSD